SLERSLLEIQTFPYIGREAEFETDLPVRFWFVKHFPNYLIFYPVSQVEVRIARVIHSARDYPSSFTKQED
ncbi:MAG: type II toxin-antitoxin system RelE/ParE family toxin, partial [Aridibacter famidurans]|nr:type II toxin-antitoxin system RelE/ParE family toxin [Aridibacter famidurans]